MMLVDGKQKGPAQESLYASEISTNPSWQPGDAEFDLYVFSYICTEY